MIIEVIYDQGTAEHREDGFIVNPPFFGVIDGFSAPHSPQNPLILFDGESGGEIIRRIALESFYSANGDWSLENVVMVTNKLIRKFQADHGIPEDRADLLAAASFVFLKIEKDKIKILQGGDCLVAWHLTSGEVGTIRNQAYGHVARNLKIIAKLMKKHQGDRVKMWNEFFTTLSGFRLQDINNPKSKTSYAALNGQQRLPNCWQKIEMPLEKLRSLLLFSYGFVPYRETKPEDKLQNILAGTLCIEYHAGGLKRILSRKRKSDAKKAVSSHITYDEATAIALSF